MFIYEYCSIPWKILISLLLHIRHSFCGVCLFRSWVKSCNNKSKSYVSICAHQEGIWRSGCTTPPIHIVGIRWRWVVSLTTLPLYPRETAPSTHSIRDSLGAIYGLYAFDKITNPWPCREWNHNSSLVDPVAQSLQRLRCSTSESKWNLFVIVLLHFRNIRFNTVKYTCYIQDVSVIASTLSFTWLVRIVMVDFLIRYHVSTLRQHQQQTFGEESLYSSGASPRLVQNRLYVLLCCYVVSKSIRSVHYIWIYNNIIYQPNPDNSFTFLM